MGTVSRDVLAKQVGESFKQVQRYIRLTELIPELLDMVDNKKLTFTVGVDISYIDKEIQKWIYEYIKRHWLYQTTTDYSPQKSAERRIS